jgi:hypothetical protein
MFKGVSQCYAHCGCALLWSVQSLRILSLILLPSTPRFSTVSIHICITSTFTSYGMQCYCCPIILFSFLSFPEFHRVVPLLQMCSTTEFVYDHVCLSWDLSSMYERKHSSFVFLILANFT